MACTFYENNRICRCAAVRGQITPSLHERERYCRSDEPQRCPTYQIRRLRTEPLPEEAYYKLWLPLSGDDPAFELASVP